MGIWIKLDIRSEMAQFKTTYDKSYALIIGINDYQYLHGLQTARFDAEETAQVLETQYGFETILLCDNEATHHEVMRRFNIMQAKATLDDRLVVYFAGHGLGFKGWLYQEGLLLTHDSIFEHNTYWPVINMSELTSQNRTQAKHSLVILDTCYSGLAVIPGSKSLNPDHVDQFNTVMGSERGSTGHQRSTVEQLDVHHALERFLTRRACYIMSSSSANESATDDCRVDGHTPFTGYLLRALTGNVEEARDRQTELLTADSVANYIRNCMAAEPQSFSAQSQQAPMMGPLMGDDGGRFVWQVNLFSMLLDMLGKPRIKRALLSPDSDLRYFGVKELVPLLDDVDLSDIASRILRTIAIDDLEHDIRSLAFDIVVEHEYSRAMKTAKLHPIQIEAQQPPDWELVLGDSFATKQNPERWPTGSFEGRWFSGRWAIHKQSYYWEAQARSTDIPFWGIFPEVSNVVTDFYVATAVHRHVGREDGEYGLVFRYLDDQNYYSFCISDKGNYLVRMCTGGQLETLLYGTYPVLAYTEAKELAVRAIGPELSFWINQNPVGNVINNTLQEGRTGLALFLYLDDTAMFEYTKFELYTP